MAALAGTAAAKGRVSRRANARDRAAFARVRRAGEGAQAGRSGGARAPGRSAGPVRLGEAMASRQPAVAVAALAALPMARGGVLLVGWSRTGRRRRPVARGGGGGGAGRAARRRGRRPRSRTGTCRPTSWRARARGCGAGWRAERRWPAPRRRWTRSRRRLRAAVSALDFGALARDPAPAFGGPQRSVGAIGGEAQTVLRDGIGDWRSQRERGGDGGGLSDRGRAGRGGKTEPPPGGDRGGACDGRGAGDGTRGRGRDARLRGGGGDRGRTGRWWTSFSAAPLAGAGSGGRARRLRGRR